MSAQTEQTVSFYIVSPRMPSLLPNVCSEPSSIVNGLVMDIEAINREVLDLTSIIHSLKMKAVP